MWLCLIGNTRLLDKTFSYGIYQKVTMEVALNPAERIIGKFGGARIIADEIGVNQNAVHKWTYPKAKGGTGGLIPSDKQQAVLDAAKRLGKNVSPWDFFEDAQAQGAAE